jgi:hypothetical protein
MKELEILLAQKLDLDIKLQPKFSQSGQGQHMNKVALTLDAVLGDLTNIRLRKTSLNQQLPLEFDGL